MPSLIIDIKRCTTQQTNWKIYHLLLQQRFSFDWWKKMKWNKTPNEMLRSTILLFSPWCVLIEFSNVDCCSRMKKLAPAHNGKGCFHETELKIVRLSIGIYFFIVCRIIVCALFVSGCWKRKRNCFVFFRKLVIRYLVHCALYFLCSFNALHFRVVYSTGNIGVSRVNQ